MNIQPKSSELTRVLCVDDSRDVTAVIQLIIDSEPLMECVGCLGSADDLVSDVQRRNPRPDVIILDATMPGRDPMQAMKELAVECPLTRTIIYSAHDDPAFIGRAKEAGAWGCVSKNVEPEKLMHAVRDVAAGRPAWPDGRPMRPGSFG